MMHFIEVKTCEYIRVASHFMIMMAMAAAPGIVPAYSHSIRKTFIMNAFTMKYECEMRSPCYIPTRRYMGVSKVIFNYKGFSKIYYMQCVCVCVMAGTVAHNTKPT